MKIMKSCLYLAVVLVLLGLTMTSCGKRTEHRPLSEHPGSNTQSGGVKPASGIIPSTTMDQKSLERVVGAGANRGGAKLAKAIPLVGTVVAVYFIYDDSKVYGAGPAIINGGIDAIPLVGTGKIIGELINGRRFLDVTVGPKKVSPSETCVAPAGTP